MSDMYPSPELTPEARTPRHRLVRDLTSATLGKVLDNARDFGLNPDYLPTRNRPTIKGAFAAASERRDARKAVSANSDNIANFNASNHQD